MLVVTCVACNGSSPRTVGPAGPPSFEPTATACADVPDVTGLSDLSPYFSVLPWISTAGHVVVGLQDSDYSADLAEHDLPTNDTAVAISDDHGHSFRPMRSRIAVRRRPRLRPQGPDRVAGVRPDKLP